MPHIKTVIGYNLKGRNFNRNLDPLSIIVGENMSGKTALLDAIRLAWLGTTHGVGKKPGEIFAAFASADSLTAALYFEDGASIERAWTKKADKVTCSVRNPQNIQVAPVLLDSQEFFGMSGEARLALLFGRMNLGKEPIQLRVTKMLDRLSGTPVARDLLAKKYKPGPDESFQAYLERVIEKMGEESRDAGATARRHREAAAAMIENQVRNAATEETFQEDEVQSDLKTARTRLEELVADKGAAEQRQAARAPSLARQSKLRQQIEAAKPKSAALETYQQGVKDADAALASYEGREAVATVNERIVALARRKGEMQGQRTADERALKKLEADYAAILQAECCPTCQTKKATWKAAATETYEARRKELVSALENADAELVTIGVEVSREEKVLAAAKEVEESIRAAMRAKAEQESKLSQSRDAREFIAESQTELDDLDKAFSPDSADRDQQEIASLQDHIIDARGIVGEHEAKLQKIADARLDARRLSETTKARDEAATLAESCKLGKDQLQAIRDEFMADAFRPLIQSVNRYAAGILKSPLEFRANMLGRVHEEKGNWIPASAFSGTETAIFLAGIQLALGSESKAKVAIVDELGRLDADRKRQLIRNVAKAISDGHLDQFIGVDVDEKPYLPLIKPDKVTETALPLKLIRTATEVKAA